MAGNVSFAYRRNPNASMGMGAAVMSLGRPGLPVAMQRFVQHRMRSRLNGLGQSAADVIANAQAQAQSPFVTPAMLANQALVVQNECAVDPYSPACAAATATGDINTGGSPGADAAYILGQYCKQNLFNAQNFSDVADGGCAGGVPTPALIAQAQRVGYTPAQLAAQQQYAQQTGVYVGGATPVSQTNISSGSGSGTQGGGPVLTATAKPATTAPPPTTQVMPTVQSSNTTGTSGGPTGSLINGQPVSGASSTTTTDYTPILLAVAAVAVLMMVSK